MSRVVIIKGRDLRIVEKVLDEFQNPKEKRVVIKPNLVNSSPPPTTTPVDIVETLAKYYYEMGYDVFIAEGSGWCETFEAYKRLGYLRLQRYAELVDLNEDEFEVVRNENALFLKEFEFPLTLKNAYVISVPVLKEHSITGVTLSLKNMLGATIGEKARVAKKGRFHKSLNESIVDVNTYIKPKMAVIDGRVAGIGGELFSKPKVMNLIIISNDLVAADAIGARYLSKNPFSIRHIKLAHEIGLGIADLNRVEVYEVSEVHNKKQ